MRAMSFLLASCLAIGVGCGDEAPLEESFRPLRASERPATVAEPAATVAVAVAPAALRKVCQECHDKLKVPKGPLDVAAARTFLTAHQKAESFTVSAAQRETIVAFLGRATKKAGGSP